MRASRLVLSITLLALAGTARAQVGADQADTTGVWYHLRRHDRAAARAELDRLRDEHPLWLPPQDLVDAVDGKQVSAAPVHKKNKKPVTVETRNDEPQAAPPDRNLEFGWAALNANDPLRAAAYFAAAPRSEESRYGQLLALSRANAGIEKLVPLCGAENRSPRIDEACGDALAAEALTAYRAGQWERVIALDAQATALGLEWTGTGVLAGWSLFRQAHYEAALKRFDESAPDPAAAEGIAQSLIALKRYDELARRADAMPALAGPYRQQVGELALIRLRPALGAAVDAPGTAGIEAPSMSAGFYDRDKSGGIGADKIEEQGVAASLQTVLGRDILAAGVETAWVRNGVSADNATLSTPWLKWERQEIDTDLSATIGTSPIGGAVSALPALGVQGEKDWSGVIANGGFKVSPRYDSLVAMAGQRDPLTGATWGRVVEIGPQLGGILLADTDFSVSGAVAYGSLQGHDVTGNDHGSATLSASYSLKMDGFNYLRVGPSYAYDAYSRNDYVFTPGHGGYYSPQASHALGLFADFLTEQGKSWLIGGRVSGSWQYSRQAGAGDAAGVNQAELGTDSILRGGVLLGHSVILGAFGRVTISPSGRDKAAGLTLIVPLSGRDGLFASDLPHFIDRSWP